MPYKPGMQYKGPISRTPSQSCSILLEVVEGCPWDNKCTFCNSYREIEFQGKKSIRPVAEVKRDIDTLKAVADKAKEISWRLGYGGEMNTKVWYATAIEMVNYGIEMTNFHFLWLYQYGDKPESAFLTAADPMVAETTDLVEILNYLYERFPSLERDGVTSYVMARTIVRKGPEELAELRKAGLTRFYLGLESGDDEILRFVNKGATSDEMIEAGHMIKEAGIELSEFVMPGLGGEAMSEQHARGTASVLNATDPDFVRMRPLQPIPGTPLYKAMKRGEFQPLTGYEVLEELGNIIRPLTITGSVCFDHDYNPPIFDRDYDGYGFQERKPEVLELIDEAMELAKQRAK